MTTNTPRTDALLAQPFIDGGDKSDALQKLSRILEKENIAHLDALKRLWTFLDDLSKSNPGYLGKLVLQDYGAMNEAFIAARQTLAKAKLL